jgi:hypothetical protein
MSDTMSLSNQLNLITNSLVERFFCKRVDNYTVSVIVYYREEKEAILNKHKNLFIIEEHNLMNGNLQLDLEIREPERS